MGCNLNSACVIACACGNEVAFGPGEAIKFCQKCGTRHSKVRKGESAFGYAGKLAEILKEKLLGKDLTFRYVAKNYTAGEGRVEVCAVKITFKGVVGVLDEGASVKMLQERHVASMFDRQNGGYGSISVDHTHGETIDFDFSEEEVLTLEPEVVYERLKAKTKPLFCDRASEEEYEAVVSLISSSSLRDLEELLHDEKTKKARRRRPAPLPEWIEAYYEEIEKIAESSYGGFIRNSFLLTPRRTLARALKSGENIPLLVITGPDRSKTLVMADEVRRGKAPKPESFSIVRKGDWNHLVIKEAS